MKVSSRAHYGLRMMTELGKVYGAGALSLAEIARAEGLPQGYLEQLVVPLKRARLVEGTRGAHGGYRLSRPPGEITTGEIVRALEGEIGPVECVAEGYRAGSCERESTCLSRPLWLRVRAAVDQVLDGTTLADLCAGCVPAPADLTLHLGKVGCRQAE